MGVSQCAIADTVVDRVGVLFQIAADGLGKLLLLQHGDDLACQLLDQLLLFLRRVLVIGGAEEIFQHPRAVDVAIRIEKE